MTFTRHETDRLAGGHPCFSRRMRRLAASTPRPPDSPRCNRKDHTYRDSGSIRDSFRVSGPRDSDANAGAHHAPNVNRDPDADVHAAPYSHCHPDSDT
ncbi:MAG: hypothetical protein ACE5F6_12430 [Anaerolineae bacterium]